MTNLSYFTILSNWTRGFDKYQRIYSKSLIKESTYPNEFYLLKDDEHDIGLNKAKKLINKKINKLDRIIKINTIIENNQIQKNIRNNLGWVLNQNFITIESVEILENNSFKKISLEELSAMAYQLESHKSYQELTPRSISYLPIAQACQAKCWFCFSEVSISQDTDKGILEWETLENYLVQSKNKGAERFVITGGGEPGLLPFDDLLKVIVLGKKYFNKIVLITNGMFLSYKKDETRKKMIIDLKNAGLSVLSISRHHYDPKINKEIMGVDTLTEKIFDSLKELNQPIQTRLICVLQKNGIKDHESILNYTNYAKHNLVSQVCFKELYVASTLESVYTSGKEYDYSKSNQISLKEVLNYCKDHTYNKIYELPWGSPIFEKDGLQIAAYTEPSVGWEISNGICRSWNIMADMKNYASLEDLNSLLEKP